MSQSKQELLDIIRGSLPSEYDDAGITPVKYMYSDELAIMAKRIELMALYVCDTDSRFRIPKQTQIQECHTMSSWLWMKHKKWKLATGFTLSEELTPELSDWHHHSWCVDTHGSIVEPTGIIRDQYYGVILTDEEAKNFVRRQLKTIHTRLKFPVTPKMLKRLNSTSDNTTQPKEFHNVHV